jgi:iron complex transport system substrate-binding protein
MGCSRGSSSDRTSTPRRVVSLSPNTTETLFAIGQGALLVGRSRYCDFPSEVASVPSVGGYVDPSMETILGLRPDLVIGARGPSGSGLVDRLSQRGIRTYFPTTESIDEILAMIAGLASIVGAASQGRDLATRIGTRLASIDERLRDVAPPRVLLVFGLSPIVVAGPGSFADEMLRHAGCANAVREGTHYPTLGLETIIGLDPELVIDTVMTAGEGNALVQDAPGWNGLRAVRDGKVAVVHDDAVLRPGPRVADGVARIARIAHPGTELP